MLGTNRSTRGSTRERRLPQSIMPDGLDGSGRLMSRDVIAPCALARARSLSSLTPAVRPDLFHEGRVPEVEDRRAVQDLVGNIVVRERVVGAGTVQEDAVHPRGIEHDGVRGDLPFHNGKTAGEPLVQGAHPLHDEPAQRVVADLRHQANREAEAVQGKPDVGRGAARGNDRRVHQGQAPGAEPVVIHRPPRETRG